MTRRLTPLAAAAEWMAPVRLPGQAKIAFTRMKNSYPDGTFHVNEADLRLTLTLTGSVIWFKSADKPDSLYGEDVYAAVVDAYWRLKTNMDSGMFAAVQHAAQQGLGQQAALATVAHQCGGLGRVKAFVNVAGTYHGRGVGRVRQVQRGCCRKQPQRATGAGGRVMAAGAGAAVGTGATRHRQLRQQHRVDAALEIGKRQVLAGLRRAVGHTGRIAQHIAATAAAPRPPNTLIAASGSKSILRPGWGKVIGRAAGFISCIVQNVADAHRPTNITKLTNIGQRFMQALSMY